VSRSRKIPSELVLVASERHAEQEAAGGARVRTLREFSRALAEAAGPQLKEAAVEATRLLTRRTLLGHPPALALAVDDALGQLRRAGTLPADLAACGNARGSLLAAALEKTDRRLAELGLRDGRANAQLARLGLQATPCPELDGVSTVRVRGVTHWEGADLALIEALHQQLRAGSGAGVVIELPSVPEALGSTLCDAVAQLATRFEQRWATAMDHPELVFVEARASARPPLVIQAAHEASEARAVARLVLDALAQGTALDRIAIVPVDAADAFLEPLRAELTAAKLPFSEAWGRATSSAPEAHAALELLRLAEGPLLRDSLVDVLRVPDLDLRALLAGHSRAGFVSVIERLPVRIDRTGAELIGALQALRLRAEGKHERELEALSAAEQVLSALLLRFERLREPSTRRLFRDRWRELFAELGLLTASRRGLAQAVRYAERADNAPLAALGENARAGRAIELSLERSVAAAELLGLAAEPLSLADFYDEFSTALSAVGANQGAGRAGALRIARPAEVSGLDWDLLIVCRAASATLDWQSSSSDGVLDGELVSHLPAARRPLTATDRALFTRVALASALARAEHSFVTWAKRDAGGGSGKSRLVMDLSSDGARVEPASPLDPAARRVQRLPEAGAAVRARAALDVRRQDFYAAPDSPLDFENGAAGPLDRWVFGDAERPVAVTQLERYARCPFLAFSGAVLRAVQDDSVGDGLSARERGSLIHEALAVALAGTRPSFATRDLAELEREAVARAEAYLSAQVSSKLRGAALKAAAEDVAALLHWSFANTDGTWFSEAERAFGSGEEWPALPVGQHFVSGRIDRIDSNSDGSAVRVIDYKTGAVKVTGDHGDQLLQPWLYARKVALQYGAHQVSSGYLSLQRRKPEWTAAVEESAPEASPIAEKLQRAEQLLISLRSGRVPARPAVAGSCTRCDARDICRRPLSSPHEAGE